MGFKIKCLIKKKKIRRVGNRTYVSTKTNSLKTTKIVYVSKNKTIGMKKQTCIKNSNLRSAGNYTKLNSSKKGECD